ncbi:MAG: ABC transporter permease [Phycisphaerales bacterium]|nr:ABC transporter permease [Phycisphaerales bacterium]
MGVLHDIGVWLWRLLPANPILVRVVTAAGHRVRHLWARVIYLLALVVVFLYGGGLLIGPERSLAELAKQYSQTFTAVSVVQLVLMSFIAPIFCAAAITQEKDSNTYHILLTTPLSNAQIVLGTLFSRLYFVWALLISGLPIFCITMIYGGVTTREIFESFGLAACTGLITGSIAIMISFLRVGTRRTIFAFFVGVAVYLLGVYAFGVSPLGQLAAAPDSPLNSGTLAPRQMSWLSIVHPFLALLVVTGQTPAPDWSDVAGFTWPASWLLVRPQYGYMILTTLASVVMILVSLVFVRAGPGTRRARGSGRSSNDSARPTALSARAPRAACGETRSPGARRARAAQPEDAPRCAGWLSPAGSSAALCCCSRITTPGGGWGRSVSTRRATG